MGSKSKGLSKVWASECICLKCKKPATVRYRPLGDILLCQEDQEEIEAKRKVLIEKAIKDSIKYGPVDG